MKRLTQNSEKNSPQEYDRIFKIRQGKGVDEFDLRRWNTLLKHYKNGEWLIDIGCLDSKIIELATENNKRAYMKGIDMAAEAIKEMNSRFPKETYPYVNFEVRDLYNTGFTQSVFDYVILGEVLEHLDDPEKAIYEAMRIARSGGTVAISVPLDEAKEPGAVDQDRHLWSIDEQDMRNLLTPYGKVEIEILRSIQEPVYKYCWPTLVAWCTKT